MRVLCKEEFTTQKTGVYWEKSKGTPAHDNFKRKVSKYRPSGLLKVDNAQELNRRFSYLYTYRIN